MAIINGSIPLGATFTPAGGTARTIKLLQNITGGLKAFIDDSPASLLLRKLLYANVKPPVPNKGAVGGYSSQKCRLEVQDPIALASGEVTVNKAFIEIWYHPESDVTARNRLVNYCALMSTDADFTDFLTTGSVG